MSTDPIRATEPPWPAQPRRPLPEWVPPTTPAPTPPEPSPTPPTPPESPSPRLPMLNEPLSAQERLFAQRLVMLTGSLDRQKATDVAALLLTLDAASDRPVTLRLDCDGDEPSAALVLVDTLDLMRAPVLAVVAGRLTGAAVAVLAAAGSRTAMPHSRVLLCEPDLPTTTGSAEAVATIAEEHKRLLDAVCDRIAAACHRSPDQVAHDLRAKRWLSPEEAVGYGLVDAVAGGPPA